MSQYYEYFNRKGVTKRGCGCTLMFHLCTLMFRLYTCKFVHNTQTNNTSQSTSELQLLFIYLLCFLWTFTVYLLKLFCLATVPLSDTIVLSRACHVRLTSIDVSKWYWDVNSLYRKMTFPKSSSPVCSCIVSAGSMGLEYVQLLLALWVCNMWSLCWLSGSAICVASLGWMGLQYVQFF